MCTLHVGGGAQQDVRQTIVFDTCCMPTFPSPEESMKFLNKTKKIKAFWRNIIPEAALYSTVSHKWWIRAGAAGEIKSDLGRNGPMRWIIMCIASPGQKITKNTGPPHRDTHTLRRSFRQLPTDGRFPTAITSISNSLLAHNSVLCYKPVVIRYKPRVTVTWQKTSNDELILKRTKSA